MINKLIIVDGDITIEDKNAQIAYWNKFSKKYISIPKKIEENGEAFKNEFLDWLKKTSEIKINSQKQCHILMMQLKLHQGINTH